MATGSVRLGCVPEHFSAPLLYAAERGDLEGVELTLFGTGDMIQRVASGELDAAICVTEGLVAGIGKQAADGLRLCGTYVESALPWAVSVSTEAKFCTLDDLAFGAKFGISREGSGSEVMARYAASEYEWKAPQFAVLGNVDGLVAGVQSGAADAFLWERTTMQRHYALDKVRYLGTVRPPWPAFSFGALLPFARDRMPQLADAVRRAVHAFMVELPEDRRLAYVCDRLGYAPADARLWMDSVAFADPASVDHARIAKVVAALSRAGAMPEMDTAEIVAQ
ncbi:hypothetical protein H4R18_000455 [Coemansia javaensis]|uniref:Ca3427-like PBP 2 domain-containing protein n=1 Tax=Coemansia javaensis TaxID=2761396 RepID=A0A9W8HJM1_9FUNG|nr:hypothetical protein H4R18_000455 [Coemansia javaensis]